MNSALDTLATLCGIAAQYEDAFGRPHEITADTKRQLLKAMRLAAETEAEANVTLDDLLRKEWTQPPPAMVVTRDPSGDVHLHITAPQDTASVDWTITTEAGEILHGRNDFSGVRLVDMHICDGCTYERRQMTCAGLPLGYHRLQLEHHPGRTTVLIVSPGRCWLPPETNSGGRIWGIAAQLYLARADRNWGIGEFTDLRELFELGREWGADVIGVNPLHALFLDKPEEASPYSPLSRYLLNVLNIDIDAIPEVQTSAELQARIANSELQQQLARCRAADHVQYTAVAKLKRELLEVAFHDFESTADPARKQVFSDFIAAQNELFRRHCLFLALRQYMGQSDPTKSDCGQWPEEYRTLNSPSVTRFEEEHAQAVRLHMWMQWIADTQLQQACAASSSMRIGLYRDLAVGAHPSGAEVWSNPDAMLSEAEVGAPPDTLNPGGQDWSLRPFAPRAMRDEAYKSFIELLRANMRFAGALRIDHAMSLARLYLIPTGAGAQHGGYVAYPVEDLVGILALESQRHRCMVIGEDLGTVASGFRERMAAAGILSYRLLLLEIEGSGKHKRFVPASAYPALALAGVASHDLPTMRGWWTGADIDTKQRLDLAGNETKLREAHEERERQKSALIDAFRTQGVLEGQGTPTPEQVVEAAHAFLASTAALLTMVQLDDLTGEAEQVNMPATTAEQYPNWRRRFSRTVVQLREDPQLHSLGSLLSTRETHAV